ncbi:hypothetical protein A2J03_28575 [Rhodococcus sp. EPR-157]|uniref:helix-turn-helix domain-containing protein n=1 Tax=Rhodococcus sp. EPR-157 TaxID=1813677 RepID=UPI0007BB59C9|nr:helix-turn-helix transcriptional regulator [Rhodococcus sp. EPR-157]KZF02532.1 hypothetical protein A2J03_28575 [Rhodococcus sp. EPR-157]
MFGDVARLGLAVRDRRARLGLSQTDLWRSGGPSNSTLTNIENGRQVPVSSFTLRKLDEALKWGTGCAYSLLHGDEGPVSVSMPGAELRAHNLAAAAAEARRALARFADNQIGFQELEACVLLLATEAEAVANDARSANG